MTLKDILWLLVYFAFFDGPRQLGLHLQRRILTRNNSKEMKIIDNKMGWRCILLAIFSVLVFSCKEDENEELWGNWKRLSDFDGIPRCDAVAFSIGNSGYIGTGYDGDERMSDFWEYNTEKNYWIQKADFPGSARNGAVAFAIGSKGYIGTGYDGINKLNDFYEFDPATNTWKKKADFPGTARYGAVGFALGNNGYIGTGYDNNYLKDFYMYNPQSDIWEKIISISGSKRRDASVFTINNKAYVVSGLDNGSYLNDLHVFDAATGEWTEKRKITDSSTDDYDDDYSNIARISAAGFSVNGKGYLAVGSSSSLLSTTWEYDPATDLWQEKTAFEGTIRTEAVGFGIGKYGYVTTGRSSSYYLDDIWSFDPTVEENDED